MPRISWRKLSRMAEKSWNSWKFSPSKFSRYTVSSRLFGGEASQCPPYSYWMKLCPVCTISSLMCALAFTYVSYTCRVWHVQYAVETAHGTPDVICQGCRHRGGLWGLKPPQIFSFTLYFIGKNYWLVSNIGFYHSKTSEIGILYYQIREKFSSKVHFYDIFNNRAENFRALRAQWSSSPPHIINCVYAHVCTVVNVMRWNKCQLLTFLMNIIYSPFANPIASMLTSGTTERET